MFGAPVLTIVDFDVTDSLTRSSRMADRHRQPHRAVHPLYPVPISPTMLVVLYVIVEYKDVHPIDLIEISEPREIAGLQDGDTRHRFSRSTAWNRQRLTFAE
jgi:hypothetical protein